MFATLFLLFASTFAETKALAVQIHLDRAGYSCSAIDGVWGPKAQFALTRFPSLPLENLKIAFPSKPACVFRLRAS